MMDLTKDAVFIEKPTGEILDVNRAGCAMLGYTREELLKMDVSKIVPSAVAKTLPKTIKRSTVKKGVYIRTQNVRKDRSYVPVEVSCTLVEISGQPRVIAIVRDISGRKVAERTLGEGEERFRKYFDNSKDGILIEDEEGNIVDANRSVCDMLGYTKEDLCSRTMRDIVPKEVRGRCPKKYPSAWLKSAKYVEIMFARRDGAKVHIEMGSSSVEIGGKKRIISIVRNISERKRAEEKLRKSELKYKQRLEKMVEEHTAKLRGTNERLLKEIGERKGTEQALRESEGNLQGQKMALERKNVALGEMIEMIEHEKEHVKSDVVVNVEKLLLPILRKMGGGTTHIESKYIDLLRRTCEGLASSFGRKISAENMKLSPREIEICNMIKEGLSGKEIAELLKICFKTVERHRNDIRKKFKLIGKKVNLTSFLRNL